MAHSTLGCGACLRRAFQVASDRGVCIARPPLQHLTRRFATEATAAAVDAPRSLETDATSSSIQNKKSKQKLEKAVSQQLKHLSDDPWAIGQYVTKALSRDAFDEALLVVQKASSREKQVVVAWNHLIDYQLDKQQVKRALKLYNDMKKRAQLPNVKTFSVIFRGLAKSQHPKLAVAEAVKHYNVLLNDSRLEPNSIHLNAVLNVCARAGDLDSLFLIANSVNETTRSPTAYTYTTILNALRHSALNEQKGLPEDHVQTNTRKLLDRATSLWAEVINKWTAGRLVIDEELVCAMGRLLLMAPKSEDKTWVFALLEQTMAIPNLLKNPELGSQVDESMRNIATSDAPKPVPMSRRTAYAVPGRNTLALVLSTLASTRHTTAGIKYWNLMVRHYGVIPDRDNWLRMFGMLKVAKSSAYASTLLKTMPAEFLSETPFKIAMETCLRDCINKNAFKNATAVLNSMLERIRVPDLHTLRLYLRTALVSHNHFRTKAKGGEVTEAKRQYGDQITEALARLWEPYKQTHYHYFKVSQPRNRAEESVVYNGKREVIALARQMTGAFDKVLNEGLLPEADLQEFKPIAAKINREIFKFFAEREKHEPNLKSASTVKREEDSKDQDEFTIKYGPEWVWDTYMPLDQNKVRVSYPWDPDMTETSLDSNTTGRQRYKRPPRKPTHSS